MPVDVTKGTSYGGKKQDKPKVIGNKHHAIDRFVASWNKLSPADKNALDRHSFAYLFGYVPEGNFHVGHQVEYILIEPFDKAKSDGSTSASDGTKTPIVVDNFVKWVKSLNNSNFSSLVDSSKLPAAVTPADVLKVMKDLPTFKALAKDDQSKLTNANISLYNIDDKAGKISIKISQSDKELKKIKALQGFKKIAITQGVIDLSMHYKAALKNTIDQLKTFKSNNTKNISYYEFTNNGSVVALPIIADTNVNLDKKAKSILNEFGFSREKIYVNLSSADLKANFDGKTSIRKPSLNIGYIKSSDQKYYLYTDHTTAYNTIDDTVVAFMKKNKKAGGTLDDFVKAQLNSIKNQLIELGETISTPNLDTIISARTSNIVADIETKLSTNQKAAFDALKNKYLPGGSNVSTSLPAKVFEKNASGKYMNGSDELTPGNGKYKASFRIGSNYNVIWGLFDTKSGNIQNGSGNISKFKDFKSNVVGHVDAIAVVDTNKNERSKKITFVFFKIGKQWIFSTDYINYIEGGKPEGVIKLITNPGDTHSTEAIMNKDFADLVAYTKVSLLK